MEELTLQTEIGEMTAVFESTEIDVCNTIYTAHFKEKPSVVVQADSIDEAIEELHSLLEVVLEVEKKEGI